MSQRDAAPAVEAAELEQLDGEVRGRFVEAAAAAREQVHSPAVVVRIGLGHVAPEARQVARDRRNAQGHALQGRVAPGLVDAGEDAQVAAADELVVLDAPQRVHRIDELRVVDDLDPVVLLVPQVAGT